MHAEGLKFACMQVDAEWAGRQFTCGVRRREPHPIGAPNCLHFSEEWRWKAFVHDFSLSYAIMQVFVRSYAGESLPVEIAETSTVLELKQHLEARLGTFLFPLRSRSALVFYLY